MSILVVAAVGVLIVAIVSLVLVIMFSKKHKHTAESNTMLSAESQSFFHGLQMVEVNQEEVRKIYMALRTSIVGMDYFLHGLLIALLAGGHVLVEGAPGLAKTKTIRLLSSLLDISTKRVQFTPDMLPADLIGVDMFNPSSRTFETFFGPLFTNILLADEINRATPKVQSALLEAMQEKQVSIGGKSYPLSAPFFVLATQNPIEQDGTYSLPEAQLDRFIMKLNVDYPSYEVEKQILESVYAEESTISSMLSAEGLLEIQQEVAGIKIGEEMINYIASLVTATRQANTSISYGASPRGSIAIVALAKALAFIEGRKSVQKKDVQRVLLPALRHRIILSAEAQMNESKDADVLYAIINNNL